MKKILFLVLCAMLLLGAIFGISVFAQEGETVTEIVKAIDERMMIHDFRMVPGATHTNLIFDVAVPFEVAMTDTEIKKEIAAAVFEKNAVYFTVITVDRV